MKWSEEAWAAAQEHYDAILRHPFINELADGTLSAARFERYIAQDELYLGNYGRQMYMLSDLMTDASEKELFVEFAREGMAGEAAMHQLLIDRFGMNLDVKPSVVTSSYNSHTQAAIETGNKAIGIAAILPCAWVYNEVGLHILSKAVLEGNPFKEWILEYGNEEFTAGVRVVLEIADRYALQATPDVRARMTREFVEATLCELAFWDYGYHGDSKSYDYIDGIR